MPSSTAPTLRRDLLVLGVLLALLLVWDATGWDLALVRMYGHRAGFALRDGWVATVMHEGGRALGWAVFAALAVNVWRPLPFARGLQRRERVWWLATVVVCLLAILLLKHLSLTSCPWSLAEFGGQARYVSHWAWGVSDGGGGGCFPSGHASTAFAFVTGGHALRATNPRAARRWIAVVLVAGLAFGWAQMMRGAHYLSHTLWTAWICYAITVVSYHATIGRAGVRRARAEGRVPAA